MSLLNATREFLSRLDKACEHKTIWIAYSGGLDSHVLLSICNSLRTEIKMSLRAIHINHGLSLNAKAWASHCKKTCEKFEISFVERTIQLDLNPGDSLEEVARENRYAIFAECLAKDDVLLTAHHQDDQAETLLLQLVRGAGPKGLAAMPALKSFGYGYQGRPLLDFPRSVLQEYAEDQHLIWVDDESNQNLSYSRNFIRHEVLSKLKSRWPAVTSSLSRSAAHCAENQMLVEEFSHDLCAQAQGSRENTLSVTRLLLFSPEKQRLILRTWMHQLKFPIPDTRKIETIQRDVLTASWDCSPLVQWGGAALRRHRDDLHLTPVLEEPDSQQIFAWNVEQALMLPHVGYLRTRCVQGHGLNASVKNVSVRYRQGGEIIDLPSRGRHTLKNLFQEWNILPWERNSIPLIFVDDKLVAVAGHFLNETVAAKQDEAGREIVFERVM